MVNNITDEMVEAGAKAIASEINQYFGRDKEYEEFSEEDRANMVRLSNLFLVAVEKVRPSGWQPIEIAPKGERIMVYYKHFEGSVLSPYLVGIIFDNDGEIYLDCDNGEITIDELNSREGLYWQPVPQPPKSEADNG